jgi:hypothetical protein
MDEYEILRKDIEESLNVKSIKDHNGKPMLNKPGLLLFLEYILKMPKDSPEKIIQCWLNAAYRKLLYKTPLEIMPLLINHKKICFKLVSSWRLRINK